MRFAPVVYLLLSSALLCAQQFSKSEKERVLDMLRVVSSDVEKNYYDARLHGVDWNARVRQAKENINSAASLNGAVSEIAALLDSLNDSHTYFIPPPRPFVDDYGVEMQAIGDRCYVTRIHPKSDAQKKNLKVGDEILAVDGHPATRATLPRILYIYQTLRPQPGLRLTVADGAGGRRDVDVMAKFTPSSVVKYSLLGGVNQRVRDRIKGIQLREPLFFERGDELLAVRIPAFSLDAIEIDDIIGKMRHHKGVVLDLRGNPGGFEATLGRLLGGFFEYDLKVFDRVGRKSKEAVKVSGRHHDAFTGRFAVLIDSDSASASELFARVIQLEKRGFILGDRSSGSVMEGRVFPHEYLLDSDVYYGSNITSADLLMSDGKSLEHVGVEPDVLILPTPSDLAARRDPAMAKAAGLVGVKVTPEEAGTFFPIKGTSED